ncbi:hypothetical protein GCM10028807_27510 [Spirosoma daeguense]
MQFMHIAKRESIVVVKRECRLQTNIKFTVTITISPTGVQKKKLLSGKKKQRICQTLPVSRPRKDYVLSQVANTRGWF